MSPITFKPAKRDEVGLLIGLAGGTGSGKTYSAMRLAKGLSQGKPFAVIDTEAGRALHYADEFDFHHGLLAPPFRPDAYLEAIKAADDAKYPVIVVDSASHEHAGEGGLLDWHEEELQRLVPNHEYKRREALTFTAWIKPKQAHKKFVNRLLQLHAHLILCFRAEEKIDIVKDDKGKTVVIPKRSPIGLDGWLPVCEKTLPFELTLSLLLTADKPGIPRPIKLQQQHRPLLPLDQPITEQTGDALSKWAHGSPNGAGPPPAVASTVLDQETLDALRQAKTASGVDAAWLQKHLKALGMKGVPRRVTWQHIKALTPDQAQSLLVALNNVVDETEEF